MPRDRIRQPPSSLTGELREYLHEVYTEIVNRPKMSYFSFSDPNSNVTGVAGDIAINVTASATTRIWLKQGSATAPSRSNWTWVK